MLSSKSLTIPFITLLNIFLLLSCTQIKTTSKKPDSVRSINYLCLNNQIIIVDYHFDTKIAVLKYDHEILELKEQPSASGAYYANPIGDSLHEKAGNVRIQTRGGSIIECKAELLTRIGKIIA